MNPSYSTDDEFVKYELFGEWRKKEEAEQDAKKIMNLLTSYLEAYIWHKDIFYLEVRQTNDMTLHLNGVLRFGDNIEDEWFVVFLLFEVSKAFPEIIVRYMIIFDDNLIDISITDNDGQFLLIESALCLPKWLKPEISHTRVSYSSQLMTYITIGVHTPWSPANYPSTPHSSRIGHHSQHT